MNTLLKTLVFVFFVGLVADACARNAPRLMAAAANYDDSNCDALGHCAGGE